MHKAKLENCSPRYPVPRSCCIWTSGNYIYVLLKGFDFVFVFMVSWKLFWLFSENVSQMFLVLTTLLSLTPWSKRKTSEKELDWRLRIQKEMWCGWKGIGLTTMNPEGILVWSEKELDWRLWILKEFWCGVFSSWRKRRTLNSLPEASSEDPFSSTSRWNYVMYMEK